MERFLQPTTLLDISADITKYCLVPSQIPTVEQDTLLQLFLFSTTTERFPPEECLTQDALVPNLDLLSLNFFRFMELTPALCTGVGALYEQLEGPQVRLLHTFEVISLPRYKFFPGCNSGLKVQVSQCSHHKANFVLVPKCFL